MDFSIVIPVYNNEESISELSKLIQDEVIKPFSGKYMGEVIFVNDGSEDNSLQELLKIKKSFSWIKVVDLTKNFGQLHAINAAYSLAKGKCVVNIAADLQDPICIIRKMILKYFGSDYPIIIAHRNSRNDSIFDKISSFIFYFLTKKLSFQNMPTRGFDIACIGRKVLDIIFAEDEKNAFWQGQILSTGYKIYWFGYERLPRKYGKTQNSLTKRIQFFLNGILSYSYIPIRISSIAGIFLSILGFIYAGMIFISKLYGKITIEGWTPIMMMVLILSGFQLLMIGILGEYMSRTLEQVRTRKKFIVKKIY